jgi:NADH dehydrogenase
MLMDDRQESGGDGAMSASATGRRRHVVIIGCGFGGLSAAKSLGRAAVDITVIDRTNHHLVQPLLHQLATGILSEGDIALPVRDVLRRQRNTRVVLGEVVDIDLRARRVTVDTLGLRTEIAYDMLIVATGARQSYFGRPEFADDAPGMKTLDDALELRGRIFGAFEMAEGEANPAARRRWLTFVIVGAGPTGVELAGQLAELSRRALRGNFRRIDPGEARVLLLGAASTILPAYPEALRERAVRDLRELGVELHLGTMVTGVDAQGVDTNSTNPRVQRIEAATKIWAAGVQASPLGRLLAKAPGVELDPVGRVKVATDCTLPGHPEVFVIGDLMSLDNLPGVTQVAIQSGQHSAHTIIGRLAGDTTRRPFRYRDVGRLAMISRFRAVAVVGKLALSGLPAWVLWLVVRLTSLTGFKNRASVLFNWTVAFLGRGRAQRVISAQQVFARQALEVHARDAANESALSRAAHGATP